MSNLFLEGIKRDKSMTIRVTKEEATALAEMVAYSKEDVDDSSWNVGRLVRETILSSSKFLELCQRDYDSWSHSFTACTNDQEELEYKEFIEKWKNVLPAALRFHATDGKELPTDFLTLLELDGGEFGEIYNLIPNEDQYKQEEGIIKLLIEKDSTAMRAHVKYIIYNYMFNRFKIAKENYDEAISRAEAERLELEDLLNDIRIDYLDISQKNADIVKEAMNGTKQ